MTTHVPLALLIVVIIGTVSCEDPCSNENGTGELCAFRGLLENTMQRVDDALASSDAYKRKSSYVRFGRSGAVEYVEPEKRKSSYVRFGRSDPSAEVDMEKRKSALVRFGRSGNPENMEKRKSSYIRFG